MKIKRRIKIGARKVSEHLKEKLKSTYFREIYELEEQKTALVKKIIDYRIRKDITQEQLGDLVGVTQQHISKIENNDFSSFSTVLKVLLFVGFKIEMEPVPLKPAEKKEVRKTIRKLQIA